MPLTYALPAEYLAFVDASSRCADASNGAAGSNVWIMKPVGAPRGCVRPPQQPRPLAAAAAPAWRSSRGTACRPQAAAPSHPLAGRAAQLACP
eukprot:288398-Prymnesium_polylepis.1